MCVFACLCARSYSGARDAEGLVSFINGESGFRGRIKKTPSDVVTLDESNFDKCVSVYVCVSVSVSVCVWLC